MREWIQFYNMYKHKRKYFVLSRCSKFDFYPPIISFPSVPFDETPIFLLRVLRRWLLIRIGVEWSERKFHRFGGGLDELNQFTLTK
jgi:hypothetical protein